LADKLGCGFLGAALLEIGNHHRCLGVAEAPHDGSADPGTAPTEDEYARALDHARRLAAARSATASAAPRHLADRPDEGIAAGVLASAQPARAQGEGGSPRSGRTVISGCWKWSAKGATMGCTSRPWAMSSISSQAVTHGDEHVIKFTDTAVEVYAATGDPDALAAADHIRDLIQPPA